MGSRIKNQTLPSKIKRIQKLTLDKFMKKERQTEKQKKSSDKYKQQTVGQTSNREMKQKCNETDRQTKLLKMKDAKQTTNTNKDNQTAKDKKQEI